MYGYAAASASASRLIPFAPQTTNSAGVVAQARCDRSAGRIPMIGGSLGFAGLDATGGSAIIRLLGQSYLATGMARFLTSIAQQLTFGPGAQRLAPAGLVLTPRIRPGCKPGGVGEVWRGPAD